MMDALMDFISKSCQYGLTPELSNSRAAVTTPAALDNQSVPPKPATPERRSGAAVRSSDLVGPGKSLDYWPDEPKALKHWLDEPVERLHDPRKRP